MRYPTFTKSICHSPYNLRGKSFRQSKYAIKNKTAFGIWLLNYRKEQLYKRL